MFGFIKRKIREFTDSFKQEAGEEPIARALGDEQTTELSATETEVVRESEASEQPDDEMSVPREPALETKRTPESERSAVQSDILERERAEQIVHETYPRSSEAEPARTARAQRAAPKPSRSEAVVAQTPSSTVQTEKSDRPSQKQGRFGKIMGALTKRSLSEDQFERIFADLEIGLLEANTAYDAVQAVKENLRERLTGERVSRFSAADDVTQALKESITVLFEEPEDLVTLADEHEPLVIMLIGINGSGKTTTAAKLARAYQRVGKRPVLAAADTFRAAAIQQLEAHARALDCRIIKHDYGADPTAVAFDAVSHAKSGKADVVIIDTAGRLHSNENLLKELEKLKRVIKPHRIIFVGESIAGNDLLEQAQTFNEKIGIDGIILTKTDVDESGGGMLSVSHVTKKPIDYLGAGQGYDDLTLFDANMMARLLGLE